jgi:hypothetical protein
MGSKKIKRQQKLKAESVMIEPEGLLMRIRKMCRILSACTETAPRGGL